MICNKCGCQISDTSAFCPHCGNSVQAYTTPAYTPQHAPAKKKNTGIIVLIIVMVVVAVLAVGAALILPKVLKSEPVKINPFASMPTSAPTKKADSSISTEPDKPTPTNTPSSTATPTPSDFLFPSDRLYISYSDLYGRSKEEVAFIRNEIYARRGYIFQTEPYKSYFSSKSWYYENPYFSESDFNPIEKANKDFIVEYEKSQGWR